MATTQTGSGLIARQWDDKFFTEYLTENRFSGEMGTNELNIVQVKENLMKKAGDSVVYTLVNKLTNAPITGRAILEGAEEDMATRSFALTVDKRRNGVLIAEIDEQYTAFSMREAAKAVLKDWSMKDTEKLIIQALLSIDGINYATASAGQRNTWETNNADRIYLGTAAATTGTLAADLLTLDYATASERLTSTSISAMKYKAMVTANPKIRPIRSEKNGRNYYVLYTDPRLFRDLKAEANSPIVAAQRETVSELENSRLFKGGDLLWDGVIIKEVPEMFSELGTAGGLNTAGTGGTNAVGCAFLCGAQAIGAAYAKRWTSVTEVRDYQDKHGVAIDSIYGIGKIRFGTTDGAPFVTANDTLTPKDNGVVTGFFATA